MGVTEAGISIAGGLASPADRLELSYKNKSSPPVKTENLQDADQAVLKADPQYLP